MKHALLLGAGFSSWAAGLPVAKDLFDFKIDRFGPAEIRQLKVVEELKHDWDQENPGAYAEKFVAHALTLPAKKRDQVLWYIGRRLTDPFIWYSESIRTRRYPLSIDEAEMLRHPAVATARGFLDPFCKGWALSGIVTPNYDLVPEYALSSRRFNYGRLGEQLVGRGRHHLEGRVVLQGPVMIAKVHGSVSWSPDGVRYAECRRGITGGALIVAPAPEKEIPKVLAPQWELAESILLGIISHSKQGGTAKAEPPQDLRQADFKLSHYRPIRSPRNHRSPATIGEASPFECRLTSDSLCCLPSGAHPERHHVYRRRPT